MGNRNKLGKQAPGKNVRVSITKMRRIIDRIQKRSYATTLVLPKFMPYRACYPVSQLVLSAATDASTNFCKNKSELFINEAWVDNSTYLQRLHPRAQGRGYPIRRRTCKVTIQPNLKSFGK